ncbi:CBS domain-containing protein [Natrialba asiatica]|uniref:Signal transduction protein with CBS domains n=1 Tax=Natrialba asiatica (strain ATCC 700177 / DSM 12278 / JCM 9576 / FERM P-10747 / NBRC 102637 / 172P1) TaxID=29540 RepID=M0AQH5_NATA1|nr:CBS domain-containing protein [Natrialba asiatica]ELZ00557.1 signal transduction protein with CBS domains [Natrialba asiatica DSM 12278]
MPVGSLGPDDVITANRDTELGEIARLLAEENVGAIVVTDDSGTEPVGIVTDRDAALAIYDHDGEDVASATVDEAMTADPATIREDAESIEISRAIDEHGARRFPVVDDAGELTGIVTLDDLVATIGEQLDNVAETIEQQSPEYSP